MSTEITPLDSDESLVNEFIVAEAQHSQAKAAFAEIKKKLMARFPNDVGEFSLKVGKFTISAVREEKDEWDSEAIAAVYGADLPAFVKRSYSVDRRSINRIPEEDREALLKCVTTKPGSLNIEIEVNP